MVIASVINRAFYKTISSHGMVNKCFKHFLRRNFSTVQSFHIRNKHLDYCQKLVKSRDYDNYLALILLPALSQNVGFAVRAFNIEIAQIQESTSIVETGKMRVDFWRKKIADTFQGAPPNHPVTILIALCLEKQWMSEKWFQRVIDVREKYLQSTSFMSLDDAEDYGEYAVSSLYYLILESLEVNNNDVFYAASHLGIANSLVTMIKSVPHFISQGQVILPTELCVKHQISQEEILRGQKPEKLAEILFDIASQASLHLDGMHKFLKESNVPMEVKNVFLPSVSCGMFLEHIRKLDFNMNHKSFNQKQWTLPLKLYLASKKKGI